MKPNIPLIALCLVVMGLTFHGFSIANDLMPIRKAGETWGIELGFSMFFFTGSIGFLGYLAGREDKNY